MDKDDIRFVQGNVACAEGAIAAGCRFFAGYPITPATEIAEHMSKRLPQVGGYYVQMEDENGALATVIGASWGGLRAMTATSGPGFTLMQENIGHAVILETPLVIANIMRGGPGTGQATKAAQGDIMQARWGSHGDYEIIALAPYSGQELYDLTIKAFELSEQYRVPVFVLGDEILGHAREKVVFRKTEIKPRKNTTKAPGEYFPFIPNEKGVPEMARVGDGYNLLLGAQTHNEYGRRSAHIPEVHQKLINRLCNKIRLNVDEIAELDTRYLEDADYLLISFGSTSRSALKAVRLLRENGVKIGFLRLITIWPFAEEKVRQLVEGKKGVFVAEMNLGQIYLEVQRACRDLTKNIFLISKIGGEMHTPTEIINEINNHIS